jgi:hypothetical protein
MSPASLLAALLACALVAAQIAFPGAALFHTWQYAFALAILAWLLIAYGTRVMREKGRRGGRMLGLALLGVLIVVADGLASGLLGPDTERVARAPGSITPIPEVGAVFFSGADPQTVEKGEAVVTVRRKNEPEIVVTPGSRKFDGALLLSTTPSTAAYIDAFDEKGNHLTVTQPTGGSFLSPVLLFADRQNIAGRVRPVDGFALPGARRSVKVVYFSAADAAEMHLPVPADASGKPALLFDVFDESGNHSLGIGVAASGETVSVGGVRLRPTLGSYPQLVIASVPEPYALLLGFGLFVFGLAASGQKPRTAPARTGAEPASGAKDRAAS